jgi:hypothetical protein
MIRIIPLLALAALPAEALTAMTDAPHALSLKVHRTADALEVELLGHSADARHVSYRLEVTGTSTSRHSGKTTLAAGTPAVLSKIRASAGEDWCVLLWAEEEGQEPYEIREGSCTGTPG